MGIEIIWPVSAFFGLCLFAFLFVRSMYRAARPFALPTLIAAAAVAFAAPKNEYQLQHYWMIWFLYFLAGAVAFGVHAHAIRWLLGRRPTTTVPTA